MTENENKESVDDFYKGNDHDITSADLNIADRAIDEALLVFERIRDIVDENPDIEELLGDSIYQDVLDFIEKYSLD